MALTINPNNINLDSIRNLDTDKQYYLSKSGQIKEASAWMKFKCWLGVSGARQKVANLIDAVRSTLLNNAGETEDDKLETDIRTINRKKMVSGEALYNLATRFAEANPNKIAKNAAERMIAKNSKDWALVMKSKHDSVAKDPAVLEKIIQHGLKRLFNNPLPMKKGADSMMKLDSAAFSDKLLVALNGVDSEITAILNKINLGGRPMDSHYAQHIIDTLFNADGTRNETPVESLKTPIQVKVDVAFKLNGGIYQSFQPDAHKSLLNHNIDPGQKVADILALCDGDQELEMLVLEKVPELCVNSNYAPRPEEKTRAMLANIKEAFHEIRELAKQFPGSAAALKGIIVSLGSSPIPKGLLTDIAKIVQNTKLDKFTKLTSLSTADEIYEGVEQLRRMTGNIDRKIGILKKFEDAGEEEVGAAHFNAAKAAAIALALAKAGPGLLARLPNIFQGTESQKMYSILCTLTREFNDGNELPGVNGRIQTAKQLISEQGQIFVGFLQSSVETALGKQIPVIKVTAIDLRDNAVSYMLGTMETALDSM